MKKIFTMILAAASIFAAVSCNRTFDEKEVPSNGTIYVTRTYKAGLDEATKTTIDAAGKVTWEQGDLIRYYSQKNGEVKTYTIDAPSAKAELALDVASTANFLIGVYGGTALTDNLGSSVNIQGAIPTEQTGVFGDHHVAITKTYDVTQQSLTFHNIVSYLKFTLTRDDVAKVVFKANDGTQLHGNGSVTVSLPDETPSAAFGSEGGSSITVLNGGAGTFYIATLPCTMEDGFQVDCYDSNGTYLGSALTSKSVEVKVNKVLNLGVIDTRIEKMYTDISAESTANCYIISEPGNYKIKANVKGNSTEPLDGIPAIAEVLWESFGTDVAPSVGDLISGVSFKDGYIRFTASALKGNAVIAVEDRNEDILWSWHIWLTDQPSDQVYNNGAGTMMDRNLGATSATPGDVHALGLLYQWGRKDPFLGGESISSSVQAKSTASWPAPIEKDASCGTIEYATSYPTTFIKSSYDWYYTSSLSIYEDTRWQDTKTVYDPCPPGYKVPSGSFDGFWFKALNVSANWTTPSNVDATNKGMNFSITDHKLGMAPVIWYPFAGDIDGYFGGISNVGRRGGVWTYATWTYDGCYFGYWDDGSVFPTQSQGRATGRSVRCVKESTSEPESDAIDLSTDGTANSYIVSAAGDYKIKTVKGNSSESVGSVASAEVLWESFGTNVAPSVGDLVSNVSVDGEYIKFRASALKGNASIAAKDASGTILWSWHIWMTDQPADQVYNNGAGTMMDRNLGATSATPGDVHALGLLYQWGRKDPFLGGMSISGNARAVSTVSWPSSTPSDAVNGNVAFAISHPMSFITYNRTNFDWLYTGTNTTDDTRWQNANGAKGLYDPCPVGYCVPRNVWTTAFGSSSFWTDDSSWNDVNKGIDFGTSSQRLGDGRIWYPAAGYLFSSAGTLGSVGISGGYWSTTPSRSSACYLYLNDSGSVEPASAYYRAFGLSVRCCKEGSESSSQQATDLSAEGTANSYIVSAAGEYKIKTVKGNSSESVGSVASAEVLWESFGTNVAPSVGDLVSNVSIDGEYIKFRASALKGNASIAAKDASGTILWSWHIWLTDQPSDQVYNNGAGTMMDRNLGATSATPGDVHALGLLYQWGRKDPFLGGFGILSDRNYREMDKASSTITWPKKVYSTKTQGTTEYSIQNPTTFIAENMENYDWLYTGTSNADNTRWSLHTEEKGIYDPCPSGYRVPEGGKNGVWSKALGTSIEWNNEPAWDSTNRGVDFSKSSKKLGSTTIWYPAPGTLGCDTGILYFVGGRGCYWSCSTSGYDACYLKVTSSISPSSIEHRGHGYSVRCQKIL